MEEDKSKKIKEVIKETISFVFNFIITGVNLMITIFLLFGAFTSMVLLLKMFPETALILLKPAILVFDIFMNFFYVAVFILLILGMIYLVFELVDIIRRIDNKRDMERKKFLDDVVKKINKGRKNK